MVDQILPGESMLGSKYTVVLYPRHMPINPEDENKVEKKTDMGSRPHLLDPDFNKVLKKRKRERNSGH